MLHNEAEVNVVGGRYDTVLLAICANNGCLGSVMLLLEHGADVNATSVQSYAPLVPLQRWSFTHIKAEHSVVRTLQPQLMVLLMLLGFGCPIQ